MRITFIGHASMLIETRGISILSDPWSAGPAFGNQWWNHPPAAAHLLRNRPIDYIYISHGHHDHLHADTLRQIDRGAQVLVSRGLHLDYVPKELGFAVREVDPAESIRLKNDVEFLIWPTRNDDTLSVVNDAQQVCVNLNDALHSAGAEAREEFAGRLRRRFPRIDYLFCGYGVASHFPNCYLLPHKDAEATARKRQRYFNDQWAAIVAALQPSWAFPFAADVVLLEEELIWANAAMGNFERPQHALRRLAPSFTGQTRDIAPGFCIEDGVVKQNNERTAFSVADLEREFAEPIELVRHPPQVDDAAFEAVLGQLRANAERCRERLASFASDYRFSICFRDHPRCILISKTGTSVKVEAQSSRAAADITLTTRVPYLQASLADPWGSETIFVGSGGIFEVPATDERVERLRAELSLMIRFHETAPAALQTGAARGLVRKLKQGVRAALGQRELDLYSLGEWTVLRPDKGVQTR